MHPTYRQANTVAKELRDEVWWDEDAGLDKTRVCPILTLIPNHSALATSFSCLVAPNIMWILIHLSLLPKHTDIYRCHRHCKEHNDNPNRYVQKGKLKYTVVLIVSFGVVRCVPGAIQQIQPALLYNFSASPVMPVPSLQCEHKSISVRLYSLLHDWMLNVFTYPAKIGNAWRYFSILDIRDSCHLFWIVSK